MADTTATPIVATSEVTPTMDSVIGEITERWEGKMKNVCEHCMYNAIRHQDRNCERYCERADDDDFHFERYDGDMYAYAGGDIGKLLEIIKQLQNPPVTTGCTNNSENPPTTTSCTLN